jgi:hypothetical protein
MSCTVAELLGRISAHELTEWEAYRIVKHEKLERARKQAEAQAKLQGRA